MACALELTRRAFADIDAHFTFVKARSGRAAAERWREALFQRLSALQTQPEMWPLAEEPDLADAGVHEFLFRRWRYVYRILFRVDGEIVRVHRVRSAFQDRLTADDV